VAVVVLTAARLLAVVLAVVVVTTTMAQVQHRATLVAQLVMATMAVQ